MQGIIVVGYPFMKPATMDIQVCETVKSIRLINVINNYFSDFPGKNELCFSTYICMLCIHFVHFSHSRDATDGRIKCKRSEW